MYNTEQIAKLIGTTLGLYTNEVKALLLKNKVIIDSNINNEELLKYTLNALQTSPSFQKDFESLYDENESTILKNS